MGRRDTDVERKRQEPAEIGRAALQRALTPELERVREDQARVDDGFRPMTATLLTRLLDRTLTAAGLWKEHGLNAKTLGSRLTRQLGVPLWTYVVDRRTEVAKRLLADESLRGVSVRKVAQAVGYTHENSLTEIFRPRVGMTPSEYRRRHAEPDVPPARTLGLFDLTLPAPAADPRTRVEDVLAFCQATTVPADLDEILGRLEEARAIVVEQGYDDLAEQVTAYRGLLLHLRGVQRIRHGDVDRAYADLVAAEAAYRAVPVPPPAIRTARELVPVPSNPRVRFLDALCRPCRLSFTSDVGTTARRALQGALSLVPRDLAWFDVCCDGCYRLYHEAIGKARFALIDDAERAWWLVSYSFLDVETAPPSLGRYVAALHESERRAHRAVDERRPFCQTAVDVALKLDDPRLVAQARIYLANLERLASRLDEAERLLELASEPIRGMPWLEALRWEAEAAVLVERKKLGALEPLQAAFALYESREPYRAGRVLMRQAMLEHFMGEHEQALATFQAARSLVDDRRDPVVADAVIPINQTALLGHLGRLKAAQEMLESCDFDRSALPALAALEEFHWACLYLAHGRVRQALALFVELGAIFEELKQPLQVALVRLYSVDALVGLGRRDEAMATTAQVARYFRDAGFGEDEQRALAKLRDLLAEEVVDATAVSVTVRSLARRFAGWIPAPCQEPGTSSGVV